MKIYMVFCIRDVQPRLVHAYESFARADEMMDDLIAMNEDETAMYVVKEVEVSWNT